MSLDLLAMLQFVILAGTVLGLCVWLIYFLFIRRALRKQNIRCLDETSMSVHDLAEAEEVQMITAFRALADERKVIAIKLVEALK